MRARCKAHRHTCTVLPDSRTVCGTDTAPRKHRPRQRHKPANTQTAAACTRGATGTGERRGGSVWCVARARDGPMQRPAKPATHLHQRWHVATVEPQDAAISVQCLGGYGQRRAVTVLHRGSNTSGTGATSTSSPCNRHETKKIEPVQPSALLTHSAAVLNLTSHSTNILQKTAWHTDKHSQNTTTWLSQRPAYGSTSVTDGELHDDARVTHTSERTTATTAPSRTSHLVVHDRAHPHQRCNCSQRNQVSSRGEGHNNVSDAVPAVRGLKTKIWTFG